MDPFGVRNSGRLWVPFSGGGRPSPGSLPPMVPRPWCYPCFPPGCPHPRGQCAKGVPRPWGWEGSQDRVGFDEPLVSTEEQL